MIKLKFKILGALALISAIGIDCTILVKPATAQTAASLAYHLKQECWVGKFLVLNLV
jgi:hypothetical protein